MGEGVIALTACDWRVIQDYAKRVRTHSNIQHDGDDDCARGEPASVRSGRCHTLQTVPGQTIAWRVLRALFGAYHAKLVQHR